MRRRSGTLLALALVALTGCASSTRTRTDTSTNDVLSTKDVLHSVLAAGTTKGDVDLPYPIEGEDMRLTLVYSPRGVTREINPIRETLDLNAAAVQTDGGTLDMGTPGTYLFHKAKPGDHDQGRNPYRFVERIPSDLTLQRSKTGKELEELLGPPGPNLIDGGLFYWSLWTWDKDGGADFVQVNAFVKDNFGGDRKADETPVTCLTIYHGASDL
jgi:hypothetical protein